MRTKKDHFVGPKLSGYVFNVSSDLSDRNHAVI
jgi:hypothetical protein